MSLDIAFNAAVSGLRTAQRGLATSAHNIANVDTPGFTKKVTVQEALAPSGIGYGVLVGETQRLFDQALYNQLLDRTSAVRQLNVRNDYLRRVEEVQGAPEAGLNVAARLSEVRDAFVRLGTTPESPILQRDVVLAADTFARTMNDISRTMLDNRNAADAELADAITGVNGLLNRIETLDAQIILDQQRSPGASDLEDQRDAAIEELSQLVAVRVLRRNDGSVLIATDMGATLFDRVAQPLAYRPSQLDHSSYYRTSPPGTIAPITVGTGDGARDITSLLRGGKIGGLLDLRDRDLPRMQAELDNLAYQVSTRMLTSGLTLFTRADGTSTPTNLPSSYTGFAGEIRVSQAVHDDPRRVTLGDAAVALLTPPAGPVQNPPFPLAQGAGQVQRIINQVFDSPTGSPVAPHSPFATRNLGPDPLAGLTTTLPPSATLTDYAAALVAKHGGERRDLGNALREAEAVELSIRTRYQDATGVNMDDELAKLQVLQRSYGASAQILRSIERMTNDLFAIR